MSVAVARRIGECAFVTVLLVGGLVPATPLAAQPVAPSAYERGKTLYAKHCAVCHGHDGRADSPVGRLLKPRPRNFADPIEMARVTVDRIYRAVKEGRSGTAMAAWGQVLTETEIGDVIDYVHSLTPPRSSSLSTEQLSLEIGRRIYARECVSCHGADGRADTEVAKVLHPPPRKFADPIEMARLDDGRVYAAIIMGRPGTAMGGRGQLLSQPEVIDVIRYIRTLTQALPAGMTPVDLDLRVGEQIYQSHCMACHGEDGRGQTLLGLQLVPRPADFTRIGRTASVTDADLARSITRGVPGTAMAPWDGVLNKDDVRRVLLFIRQKFARQPSTTLPK